MSAVSVAGIVVAMGLAGQVQAPAGGDEWTDGAAGAWLWILVGLVPVVVAGLVTASRRRARPWRAPPARRGDDRRRSPPSPARRCTSPIRSSIGNSSARSVPDSTWPPSCSPRAWSRRWCAGGWRSWSSRSPCSAARRRPWRWGSPSPRASEPRLLPAVSPLQVPSLSFFDTPGEAVLLALALVPLVAGGILVWTLFAASLDERRRVRWLALSLVTAVGVVAVMQLVRLLGLVEVGDGFLAALPRAVAWAAVAGGAATTIVQPELGDAAVAVRRVAVGVGPRLRPRCGRRPRLVRGRCHDGADRAGRARGGGGAHGGRAPPSGARLAGAGRRPVAVRRDRQRRPADRRLRCRRRARRAVRAARAARRHRPPGAAPAVGQGVDHGVRPGRRDGRRDRRRAAGPGGPVRPGRGRRAAGAARVRAQAGRPAQRPRPPAARRARSRGRAPPADGEPGGRARGAPAPDRAAGRRDRRLPGAHRRGPGRGAPAHRARHPRRRAAGAGVADRQAAAGAQPAPRVAGRRLGDDRRRPGRRAAHARRRAGHRPGDPPGDPRRPRHRAGDRRAGEAAAARGHRGRRRRSWRAGGSGGRSRARPTSSPPRRSPTSSSTPTRPRSPSTWRSTTTG